MKIGEAQVKYLVVYLRISEMLISQHVIWRVVYVEIIRFTTTRHNYCVGQICSRYLALVKRASKQTRLHRSPNDICSAAAIASSK